MSRSITFQFSLRSGEYESTAAPASGRRGKNLDPAPDEPATRTQRVGVERSPYSLLITDDDPAFRDTLQGIFQDEGFRTFVADSGEEALDILHGQPVDVALLDQHLPRLTGLETLRIIRQMNEVLPVILLTGDSTQQLLRDALSAQAFCVMSKPVSRNVVVYTVQRAIARSYQLNIRITGESHPKVI